MSAVAPRAVLCEAPLVVSEIARAQWSPGGAQGVRYGGEGAVPIEVVQSAFHDARMSFYALAAGRLENWQAKMTGALSLLAVMGVGNFVKLWT